MDKEIDISIAGVDERIESYLRGTMNADEEEAFKQEIKSNPELRNRAMGMTALAKGIHTGCKQVCPWGHRFPSKRRIFLPL